MPLYFGFPVTCREAFRLIGLNFEQAKHDIKQMYEYELTENMFMNYHFAYYANNFFKGKNLDMRLFCTDKGQCILGYNMDYTSVFKKKFVKFSEFTDILEGESMKFWCEIGMIHCEENFNKITLKHMEDEPEIIKGKLGFGKDVEPYIIEFHA